MGLSALRLDRHEVSALTFKFDAKLYLISVPGELGLSGLLLHTLNGALQHALD